MCPILDPDGPENTGSAAPPSPTTTVHKILGGELGAVVQARDIAGGVHIHPAGDGGSGPPRQVMPPPRHFTNREEELEALYGALAEAGEREAPAVVVLSGMGGAGKSVLAARFLHLTRAQFPDGQLYAALDPSSTERGPSVGDVLGGFLLALGRGGEAIPADAAGRAGLFRTVTHGRRLAILVEDALTAAQVRSLLPGSGAHLVLVTSRLRLGGLVFDGARIIEVGPLGESAGLELLRRVVPDERAEREPEAARRLVALCDRLPLAVCAAGAGAAIHPGRPLSHVAHRLSDEQRRLDLLSQSEESHSVRGAIELSVAGLSGEAARLYTLLGVHPGREVGLEAAAALAGQGPEDMRDLLQELVAAHLLGEVDEARYRRHALVRVHAQEKLVAAGEFDAAGRTLIAYYRQAASAADALLRPYSDRHRGRSASASRLANPIEALGWLDAERETLADVIALAARRGQEIDACELASAMWPLFVNHRPVQLWQRINATALDAARRIGDADRTARVLNRSGMVHLELGDADQALDAFTEARTIWQHLDNPRRVASATRRQGLALAAQGRPAQARTALDEARRGYAELGRGRDVALTLVNLAEVELHHGHDTSAAQHIHTATDHLDDTDPRLQARARTVLGRALTPTSPQQARTLLNQALADYTHLHSLPGQAQAHEALAALALHHGATTRAREHLTQARTLHQHTGATHHHLRINDLLNQLAQSE